MLHIHSDESERVNTLNDKVFMFLLYQTKTYNYKNLIEDIYYSR